MCRPLTVTLTNVTDSFAQVLPNTAVSASFLLGDATGTACVNATDVAQVKAQSGIAVTRLQLPHRPATPAAAINATDVGQVKPTSGNMLPPVVTSRDQ